MKELIARENERSNSQSPSSSLRTGCSRRGGNSDNAISTAFKLAVFSPLNELRDFVYQNTPTLRALRIRSGQAIVEEGEIVITPFRLRLP